MLGGDMFTAYSTGTTTCAIQDRRATSKALPVEDTSNVDGFADWTLDSCSMAGGVFTIAATRAFITYDVHDLDFVSGPMVLLFAWGKTTPTSTFSIAQHDGGNLPRSVSLWGEAIPVFNTSAFESDYDTEELYIGNVSIGNGTSYTCRGYNLTQKNSAFTQAIAFEPIVDDTNANFLHHMVLYTCKLPITTQVFECVNMPTSCSSGILYAWGKGGNPFVLPPVTGLEVGSTGRIYVALQMHYNNVDDVQDLIDDSGVRIYRTNQQRATSTGMVIMGTIQLNLTYGRAVIGVSGECNASVTQNYPAAGLNVFSSFMHMHQRGRRIWTNVIRNGSLIGTMGNTQAYDFNLQTTVALTPTVTMLPGDRFVTYCVYDTSNDARNVLFGETTAHEMCINFMAYYPAFGVNPTMNCGVSGNPQGSKTPGSASCVLLPNEPPSAYTVQGWTVADSFYLTGGTASCAPGFVGAATLGCTGYGAPFTFSGCQRAPITVMPSTAPSVASSTAPSVASSTAPSVAPSTTSSTTGAPSQQSNPSLNSASIPVMSAATLMSLALLDFVVSL
jgi:hypothetical protein